MHYYLSRIDQSCPPQTILKFLQFSLAWDTSRGVEWGRRFLLNHRLNSTFDLSNFFRNPLSIISVRCREVSNGPHLNELLCVREVSGNVTGQLIAISLTQNIAVKISTLRKVIFIGRVVSGDDGSACYLFAQPSHRFHIHRPTEAVGKVIWCTALVVIASHRPIPLIVIHAGIERLVDRQKLIIRTQAMPVRVIVGKQAPLEHFVGRGLDPWNHVCRGKGNLFDLGKVIPRISIEHDSPNLDQRKIPVRPNFGDIERIEIRPLCFVQVHDLQVNSPRREVFVGDGIEKVPCGIVRVRAGQFVSLLRTEIADPLVGFKMVLHPTRFAFGVDIFESV
mmetsp:Transcript_15936/g.22467  ORF Transcript_15936/g.22467 Transcript_15936/m.22467 type:complete len:335 (-) Transcript_15936:686-1690(-)